MIHFSIIEQQRWEGDISLGNGIEHAQDQVMPVMVKTGGP